VDRPQTRQRRAGRSGARCQNAWARVGEPGWARSEEPEVSHRNMICEEEEGLMRLKELELGVDDEDGR